MGAGGQGVGGGGGSGSDARSLGFDDPSARLLCCSTVFAVWLLYCLPALRLKLFMLARCAVRCSAVLCCSAHRLLPVADAAAAATAVAAAAITVADATIAPALALQAAIATPPTSAASQDPFDPRVLDPRMVRDAFFDPRVGFEHGAASAAAAAAVIAVLARRILSRSG